MPTARSWPEPELSRALADVRHLLWFRRATVRRPRAAALALAGLGLVTVAAVVLPALLPPGDDLGRLLRPALAALVLVAVSGAVAGGGGRELLARDPASVFPVSPVTDHLGALLLAPLSAGWLIQAWGLLGLVAAVAGPGAVPVALAWLVAATALAQAVGWAGEYLRRRGVLAWFAVPLAGLGVLPAPLVADAVQHGGPAARALAVVALLAATVLLVAAGAVLAVVTARRVPRDETRREGATYAPRPLPASDLALLRRTDRASVWRSVPLRRGTVLLALAPGTVALAGGLAWSNLVLLPGLVASGCVLLFGVNLWCLDGRGLLWRESLPVSPCTVLLARALVLAEVLLGAGTATLALGALRAGRPTAAEALAVVLALLVVVAQSLSAALRWSLAHPYAVDLRSARATPAPPLAMVGYSLRLSVATTLSGLLLAGFARVGRADLVGLTAALLVAFSAVRIGRAAHRWSDPVRRAAVVAVVAA
ncbi:hypothetical protein QI633_00455 [Nocardioides sp. QY071]|uniref:hypothetical protein n=1 Tax=Nocardioides sp. QY071 TaxID=3044187 RepID=UPI00249B6035|nr:hypothetical protein [Nocardioides sp. QY071]WGY02243.1 hypothetical protein QI633_00455 [Nocardioides sp. QY071]